MRNLLAGLVIGIAISAIPIAGTELSEAQKLRADNLQLKIQLLSCRVKVSNTDLTDEQAKLLREFREALEAKQDDEFDWNEKVFKARSNSSSSTPPSK